MKTLITALLLASGLAGVITTDAQAQQDSLKQRRHNLRLSVDVTAGKKDSTGKIDQSKGYFVGGITFTRLDIGFSRLIDNGSFTLSPQNDYLSYKPGKTSTVSFDVLQLGYRFNSNFKVYLAGGFDWTLIRLKYDITPLGADGLLYGSSGSPSTLPYNYGITGIEYSKNRFSNSYVHMPLNFEIRTNENHNGKRFYIIFGPEISFLINGKVKQISEEHGKVKQYGDFHFQPVRYGGSFRLGYGSLGVFTKYYFNDMFDNIHDLKNMSFGLTFGLN